MNQSEYNVKQSITIKSGCITNRYLHVITNHYHQFPGHLILNKCVSNLSLKVSVSFSVNGPQNLSVNGPPKNIDELSCVSLMSI